MSIFSDNVVVAKIHAMYGKMITPAQYEELVACKSVPDIASYLKNSTSYSNVLENANEILIHRGQLENFIKKQSFENYSKIYRYINKNGNGMFNMMIEEFEMMEVLRMILLLKAGKSDEYIVSLPGFLISKCKINLIELAKVRSFESLLEFLSKTQYHDVLSKQELPEDDSEIDYVECENSLYENFFKRMFNMIENKSRRSEKAELRRLVGTRIDNLNICSIYRQKVLFKLDSDQIRERIFPFSKTLTPDKIEKILSSSDFEQMNKTLKQMFLIDDGALKASEEESFYIERYTSIVRHRICRHYLHMSSNLSTVFYAFYILSQLEISNLIYIIEGVRYKITSNEIKKLLVW